MLDLLLATGPIFSISKILGKERTRRLEEWLLSSLDRLVSISGTLFHLSVTLSWLLLLLLISLVVGKIAEIAIGSLVETVAPSEGPSGCIGILLLLAVPLLWVYISMRLLRWRLDYTRSKIQLSCHNWREKFNRPPLWPLSALERNASYKKLMAFETALIPLAFIYTIVLPAIWLSVVLLLLPFWGANRLRMIMTPENPNYLDIIAYFISVTAMIVKFVESCSA